jgi:imidazole glycerol-phosphate synthase subunit HisF
MLEKRLIPILLLCEGLLVKTKNFKNPVYIGDPVNTIRIFNELEVDEIVVLDISRNRKVPDFAILEEIARECFIPLSYGGSVNSLAIAERIFKLGYEKIVLNTAAIENPVIVYEISEKFGSQATVVSIDYKRSLIWGSRVYADSGRKRTSFDPIQWALECQESGAGEILFTSIDHEGCWRGLDVDLAIRLRESLRIPLICHGGVPNISYVGEIFAKTKLNALGVGNLVVYQKQGMGVLINYPKHKYI